MLRGWTECPEANTEYVLAIRLLVLFFCFILKSGSWLYVRKDAQRQKPLGKL